MELKQKRTGVLIVTILAIVGLTAIACFISLMCLEIGEHSKREL